MARASKEWYEQVRIANMVAELTGRPKVLPFFLRDDIGERCGLQLARDRRSKTLRDART
jgi:hypothetical protein